VDHLRDADAWQHRVDQLRSAIRLVGSSIARALTCSLPSRSTVTSVSGPSFPANVAVRRVERAGVAVQQLVGVLEQRERCEDRPFLLQRDP
jgi:hypothetical protein